ncbi:MAG: methyltransferase domain-containing protein [Nitrososphaera sp.]|nr:methyltransferase domain-containing protein [Nitrososphaera sp.]
MREDVINLLRCPECGSRLEFKNHPGQSDKNTTGCFICTACYTTFPIEKGVPIFLPQHLNQGVDQVQSSYSAKWNRVPDIYDEGSFGTKHQHEWYVTRYHWETEDNLRHFLEQKLTILDAGCGLGRDIRWYASLNPLSTVIGADLSEAVFHAHNKSKGYSNIQVIHADLNKLPFSAETFDFVVCEQVLPCVEDPKSSVERLWSLVKSGGHFAFYVYKEKSPIREFTDDFLREKITKMQPQEAWETCSNLTRLGKALSDLQIDLEISIDIPELGIKSGRYNLQRFIYYNFLKCFWNDGMSFDENNLVNYDWFHPAYTYRHSVEEVEKWIRELEMKVLVLDTEDPSGISVLVEKA